MERANLLKEKRIGQRNHGGGLYANGHTITSSKGFALDPCNGNSSSSLNQAPRNQVLKVGRVRIVDDNEYSQIKENFMVATSTITINSSQPQLQLQFKTLMKRKLEQYTGDGKSAVAFGLNSEKSGKKLGRGEPSSILCPPNCIDNVGDSLKGKHVSTAFSSPNDTDCSVICYQDRNLDSNESISGLYPKKNLLENHSKESKLLVNAIVYANNAKVSIQEKPNIDSLEKVLKSCAKEDSDDSSGTRNSQSLENELEETINGDNLSRPVIPIGPKFQADVPKWEGKIRKINKKDDDDDDDSKWLGTQIWPIRRRSTKTNAKAIGKGRPSLCKCKFSGSVNCVKQHISEARLRLKYDIGPAFWSWKFNEMGENVFTSWTLSEEEKFESLVKRNPLSSETDFWELASESFPSKSLNSMVSYYYNVYMLRRMSLDTRSSLSEVVSDDD